MISKLKQISTMMFIVGVTTSLSLVHAQTKTKAAKKKELIEELKNGNIPTVIREELMLVDEDSAAFKEFHTLMTDLYIRLVGNEFAEKNPVRFVLTDDSSINAYRMSYTKPPVIGFNRGTFQKLDTLDQLAYILGHEITHLELANELGEGKNSKGEEFAADLRPLLLMQRAGLDPKEALTAQKLLKDITTLNFGNYIDPHGLPIHRISAVEKGLAFLDSKEGGLHRSPTKLPQEFRNATKGLTHVSYLEEKKSEKSFDAMSVTEQLDFLKSYLVDLEPEFHNRYREWHSILNDIAYDPKNIAHRTALDALADAVLDDPKYSNISASPYVELALMDGGKHRDRPKPIGRLRKIRNLIKAFTESSSREDAEKNAIALLAALQAEPYAGLEQFNWSTFKIPNLDKDPQAEASWNQFIPWAKADSSKNILRALWTLGIEDPRLYPLMDLPLATELFEASAKTLANHGRFFEAVEVEYDGTFSKLKRRETIESRRAIVLSDLQTRDFDRLLQEAFEGNEEAKNALRTLLRKQFSLIDDRLQRIVYEAHYEKDPALLARMKELQDMRPELVGLEYFDKDMDFFLKLNQAALSIPRWSFEKGDATAQTKYFAQLEHIFKNQSVWIAAIQKIIGENNNRSAELKSKLVDYFRENARILRTDEPLFKFFIDIPDSWMNTEEKIEALRDSETLIVQQNRFSHWPDLSIITKFRNLLGYTAPQSFKELMTAIEKLKTKEHNALTNQLKFIEFFLYFQNRPLGNEPWEKIIGEIDVVTVEQYLNDVFSPALRNFQKKLYTHVKGKRKWPTDIGEKIRIWKLYSSNDLFDANNIQRLSVLKEILAQVEEQSDLDQRISVIEELLFGTQIEDFSLRDRAYEIWVAAQAQKLGIDDRSPAYDKKIKSLISTIQPRSDAITRLALFSRLADRIEAQRDVAFELEKGIVIRTREKLESTHINGIMTETFLTLAKNEPKFRTDLIHFLTEPISDEALRSLRITIKRNPSPTLLSPSCIKIFGPPQCLSERHFWKKF